MTDEPWRKAFEDLDTEVLAAQAIALGAPWAAIVVACALLDAGTIDRPRLLAIVDALISMVTTLTADDLTEPDDATRALVTLRDFLEETDLPAGRVVETLRAWDDATMRLHFARLMRRPPRG